MLSPFRRG
jgi:hypothetical protein